jgi:tetratricopeptide (TPR) repeat protein
MGNNKMNNRTKKWSWVTRLVLIVFSTSTFVPLGLAQESGAEGGAELVAEPAADGATEPAATPAKPKVLRLGIMALPQRGADAKAAKLLQALLRSEVRRLQDAQLELPSGLIGSSSLSEIYSLLNEGAALLRVNKFNDALPIYQQAETMLENTLSTPDRRLMARLYKGLSICQWVTKDRDNARTNARRSLLFWPEQTDTEWSYNLEAARLFRDVKVGWSTSPHGQLMVQSQPAGADVYVNGQHRGFAPVEIPQSEPASHHIFVASDGFVAQQQWVDVQSEQLAPVLIRLAPISSRVKLQRAMNNFRRVAYRVGRTESHVTKIAGAHGEIDAMLVLSVRSAGGTYTIAGTFWKEGEGFKPVKEKIKQDAYLLSNIRGLIRTLVGLEYRNELEPLEPPVAPHLAGANLDGLTEGGETFIEGGGNLFGEDRTKQEASIFSQWWFWAGTAVLVGGVVTAVVVIAGGSGSKAPTGSISLDLHSPSAP